MYVDVSFSCTTAACASARSTPAVETCLRVPPRTVAKSAVSCDALSVRPLPPKWFRLVCSPVTPLLENSRLAAHVNVNGKRKTETRVPTSNCSRAGMGSRRGFSSGSSRATLLRCGFLFLSFFPPFFDHLARCARSVVGFCPNRACGVAVAYTIRVQ